MKKKDIVLVSLAQALGLVGYCFLIGWGIFNKAEVLFGDMNESFGPMFFLMIFVLSVLICGVIAFGYPVNLYLKDKNDRSPIQIVVYMVGWLFLSVIVVGVIASVL